MLVALVRYCMLLRCESLIHVEFIPLFVIHGWCPPLNGAKKYLTRVAGKVMMLAMVKVKMMMVIVMMTAIILVVMIMMKLFSKQEAEEIDL